MKLKYGHYYWIYFKALEPLEPLMIGQYFDNQKDKVWIIDGKSYIHNLLIKVICEIKKPNIDKYLEENAIKSMLDEPIFFK